MYNNSGGQTGPSKGVHLSFLTQSDQAKFEQLFSQSAASYGGNKIPANVVSELLRRSNLDNDTLAKIWDLASIAQAPHLTFPEFAVAMFLTSKKLMGQTLPGSLPPNIKEETEIAMATIASTETSQQLVNTSVIPQSQPQMHLQQQPQPQFMTPMMTGMPQQIPMMTGVPMQSQMRPTPPPVPQMPMQTGYFNNYQAPMQTGFQPSFPPSQPANKPRLQNLDFAKKMMPNQNGVTNLLNPSLGTSNSNKISWKISPEDKQRYREIFNAWEGSGSGFMSGETAKDVLTQSQLPPSDLMKIWKLADRDNKGSLDEDEFAVAMHLVYRKLNGFEIPSVLPAELAPPSSVLKKFVLGRRPPPFTPTFDTSNSQQYREEDNYSSYNGDQNDYVSSARRRGLQPVSNTRSYTSRYNDPDDEADVLILEDLRRQIYETKRTLDRMPKSNDKSRASYSASSKYSLEELKEKIRKAHDDINHTVRTNPTSRKYMENEDTLLELLETQKSLQDEIQYLCNRDIPVLARQLRSSAAELRDAKVRYSRKNDGTEDYMPFIQPTGPGGSITESDRVRAKAKAMMAARKAGNTGSSTDASLGLRRAEEQKEETNRKADSIEREMEKSRTALLDLRGDLRYFDEMTKKKGLEDKKRFENNQDLSYELRHFIEQLENKKDEYSTYTSRQTPSVSVGNTSEVRNLAAPSPSPAKASSPKPNSSPARPRTAEEIKKEAERRVQERLAAIQARRKPTASTKPTSSAAPPVSKPNEAEKVTRENEEIERKNKEAELERTQESERLQRERREELERETENARKQQEDEENRRRQEEKDLEERRQQVLAKEEAERQARFEAINREEEAEAEDKAQKVDHTSTETQAEVLSSSTDAPTSFVPPPPPPPPPAPLVSTISNTSSASSNNPFAKIKQSDISSTHAGSSNAEKPNEPSNKRVSYNPFAAFSAFSATKAGTKDDTDSDDDDWGAAHDDSEDEHEFPAAGSAKNLAGKLFSAISKKNGTELETVPELSSKLDEADPKSFDDQPLSISPTPITDTSIPTPPPPPPVSATSAIPGIQTAPPTSTTPATTPAPTSPPAPPATTTDVDTSLSLESTENHSVNDSSSMEEFIALWDYPGSGPDDLVFSQDDVILVQNTNESEDWWYGTLKENGKTGYFPKNYVQSKSEGSKF
ncbi:MAG: hypothetical protein EXX96DRAFT_544540 [Benjaminiella poitrasii]|nr:MAG: hypothetical protein EXX96DRAFT_544540 [Benjaminiella poitrasii]